MNHLAHAFLSPAEPRVLIGNVVADSIRGRPAGPFAEGVAMHRRLDTFVDEHPAFLRASTRLRPFLGRYAGIALDVYFDHLLAEAWEVWAAGDLEGFTTGVYRTLQANEVELPEPFRSRVSRMIAGDWLGASRLPEAVDRTLRFLSGRLKRENPLSEALPVLQAHRPRLQEDFEDLLPDAIRAAQAIRGDAAPCRLAL